MKKGRSQKKGGLEVSWIQRGKGFLLGKKNGKTLLMEMVGLEWDLPEGVTISQREPSAMKGRSLRFRGRCLLLIFQNKEY